MKPTQYNAVLDFGKVDYEGLGEKNRVTVEIELRGTQQPGLGGLGYGKTPKDLELSISGNIWNARGNDTVSGGQNYDELLKVMPTPLMHEIVGIWKRWHLNSLKAGDAAQEEYLREHGRGKDYEETCAKLETAGLLEHDGYKYGSAWKYEELPREVIQKVMSWEKSKEFKR